MLYRFLLTVATSGSTANVMGQGNSKETRSISRNEGYGDQTKEFEENVLQVIHKVLEDYKSKDPSVHVECKEIG